MTKGGARTRSAKKAVAKGMGISIFFNVLEEINRLNNWISVDAVMKSLHFGGTRNETCRSYFKELWRYGLILRKEGSILIDCTPENWKKGGRPLYSISDKGRNLLNVPDRHRVFALAWLMTQANNEQDFEQLNKAINTFRRQEVPLSMFKACKITGVVRDSIKAIMYGWLEPLGFLDRTDKGTFKLREDYYEWLCGFKNMEEATPVVYPNEICLAHVRIETIATLDPVAPEVDSKVNIPFRIFTGNIQRGEIELRCKLYPLFYNRFKIPEVVNKVKLKAQDKIEIIFCMALENKKISESFKSTELGIFEIRHNKEKHFGALPTIFLTTKAHLHEIHLARLLASIGYEPITFTKSDRPDMILFPYRKEKDLEKFLHNKELKILVETTSTDELTLSKVEADLKNFKEHTKKVLKINAERTLIVGKKIARNIEKNIKRLQKKYHLFTIINIDDLEFVRDKVFQTQDNSWEKIGRIFTYNGIVSREFIEKILN